MNFTLSRADIETESQTLDAAAVQSAIEAAGYSVPLEKQVLGIGGMSCAGCAAGVEKALTGVPGVIAADINLALEKADVHLAPGVPVENLLTAVERAGFTATLPDVASPQESAAEPPIWQSIGFQLIVSIALTVPLVLQMVLMLAGFEPYLAPWMEWLLATPVQVLGRHAVLQRRIARA